MTSMCSGSPPRIGTSSVIISSSPGFAVSIAKPSTDAFDYWALARARMGDDPAELSDKAEAAGYDLTPVKAFLGR